MGDTTRIKKQQQKWAQLEQESAHDSIELSIYSLLCVFADNASGKSEKEQECNLARDLIKLTASHSDPRIREVLKKCTNDFINTTPWDIDLIQ